MYKKNMVILIVIVLFTVGCFFGKLIFSPLLNYLKPDTEFSRLVIITPGRPAGIILLFCLFWGLFLGLIPLMKRYLYHSKLKPIYSYLLIVFSGLFGALWCLFYFKIRWLQGETIMRNFGFQNSMMQIPRLYFIPLSGIVLMLLTLLVLKYTFNDKEADAIKPEK